MLGTVKTVIQTMDIAWQFAESQWYCADCGIVSSVDVQKENDIAETGVCRCGQEISKSTF